MPLLSFRLKVAPLQNDKAQLEGDPFCVSLYQAVSRILAGDGEARATPTCLSRTKTHVTVALIKGDRDQRSIRLTVCGQDALVAVEVLLSALTEQPVWHCGRQSYRVLSVDLAGPPLASACTWSDLLAPYISRPLASLCAKLASVAMDAVWQPSSSDRSIRISRLSRYCNAVCYVTRTGFW